MTEIFLRNSTLTGVDAKLRLIDLIAVPWDEEGDVVWRDELWRESFARGAFDGVEESAGRVMVNREHVRGDTVGKVVHFDTQSDIGLLARVRIVETPRGDETLALADENMISASIAYRINSPSGVVINKRTKMRRVVQGFLDHLAMVESPTFAGAQVLAVRAEQSGLTVAETPLPETPALDEAVNSPVLNWARDYLANK